LYKDRTNHNDDYQNTCSSYSTSSTGEITAYCKDFNSNWPFTTFNSCDCPYRIRNIGGVLTCLNN
jgi:hypothetical protein